MQRDQVVSGKRNLRRDELQQIVNLSYHEKGNEKESWE